MMRRSRKLKDKIISLVLIMTMVFTLFPAGITQVYAEEISANADKIIDINDLSTDIEDSNRDEFDGATITGTDFRMQEPITIKADDISLTIENLDVNASFNGIVIAKGNTLRLTVKGTNTIKAGEGYTGIRLSEGASLIITEESTGTLNVQGGPLASIGIGGVENFNLIQIDGGTINASGTRANIGGFYLGGAGIGSGCVGNDSKIIINGGVVNATGYSNCAGIGGNSGVEISEIIINGGVVTATTANSQVAAAIGAGGTQSAVDKITINGGTVIANGSIGGGSASEPNNTILTVSDKAAVSASSISSVGSTNAVQHTANVSIHDMKLTENKTVTVNYSIDGSSFSGTTTGTLNVSNYCGTITLPKFIRPDTNTGKTLKVTVSDGTNTWSGSAPLAKTTNVVVGNKFHLGKLVFVSEKIVEDISNYQITIKKDGVTLQKGKDFEIGNIKLAEIYKGVASLWIPVGTYDVTVKTSALNNNANMTGKLIVTDGGSNQLLLLNEAVSEVPSALYLDQGNIEFGLQDGISYVSYYDNGTQKKINGVPSEAEVLVTQKSSAATSNQLVIKDGSFSIRLKNINVLNTDTNTATRKPLFDIGGNGNIFFTIEGTNTITGGTFHPIINAPSASLAFRGTGNFTVKSNKSASYAAIKAKNVTIEDVTLTAIGGNSTSDRCHGIWGSETVTINSGTVNASTGRDSGISGAVITINGGTVTAAGGSTGAGIGGSGSRININGGTISAKGGSDSSGIGSNYNGGTTEINISGGMVSATSGNDRATAIGAGNKAGMATITISGGTVIAQRESESWGNTIGRSSSSGSAVVTITGGTIKTPSITNPKNGAGESLSCITYTLDGASEGTLVTSGSESEYGINDVRTMDTDKLYFYLPSGILPSGTVPATITTKEKEYICLNDQTYLTQHVELEAATCTYAEVCKVCGGENGSALGHNYMDGYCTRCNIDTKGCVHILTAEQLIRFAKDVNKGNRIADAVLEADIDLSGYQWETICETGLYYKGYGEDLGYAGTFDGNGHVIKNVKVKSSTTMDASCGLFGTVSGTIKNLGIEGFTFVDGGKDIRTGAIVGQLITANGRVENCYVKNATIKPGEHVTGGIAGCVYDGTIENCYVVESDINGTANRYGYIVGDSRGDGGASDRPGTVNNCYTDHSTIRSNNVGNVTNCATKSAEAFASGEVTYLLNGSKSDGDLVWYQKKEEDSAPKFEGPVIYYDKTIGYYNHKHNWTYAVEGTVITVTCDATGCSDANGGSVSIAAPMDLVYDGSAKNAALSFENWKFGEETKPEITYNETDRVNVTSQDIIAEVVLGDAKASVAYQVKSAPISSAAVTVADMDYTGSELTPEVFVALDGKNLEKDKDYIVSYSDNISAGTATVTIHGVGNYTDSATGTFAIHKVKLTNVSVKQNATLTYDGGNEITPSVDEKATAVNEQAVTFTYSMAEDGTFGSMPAFTEAGIYTVYYKATALNHEETIGSFTVTVDAGENSWITEPSMEGWIYGEEAKEPVYDAKFGTVFVNYTGTANDGTTWNDEEAPSKAGEYEVSFKVDATENYGGLEAKTEFTIAKAAVTVTADDADKTYGDTDPQLGYSHTVLVGEDTLFGITVNREAGEDAGDYNIAASQSEGSNPNYDITFKKGTLVIHPAVLKVTAENKTAVYGEDAPEFSVIFEGFKNGDDVNKLDGALSFTCEYEKFADKGTYAITPKGYESGNYNFDYVDGTLTVSAKPITVTIEAKTSIYGDEIATLTAATDGIVNEDTNVYSLSTTADKTAGVGKYDITGEALDGNYSITFENGNDAYEITERELTVTVVVADKVYDGKNDAKIVSATLNNVANDDVLALVNGTAVFNSVDVEENIGITFTEFTLNGEASVLQNYTLKQPEGVTASITNDWEPTEYSVTKGNEKGWLNGAFTVTAAEGYLISETNTTDGTWIETFTDDAETADGRFTFYVKNKETGAISLAVTEEYKIDMTAPTGMVEFPDGNTCEEFKDQVTFDLLVKDDVIVKAEAEDALSGIADIAYAISDKALTLEEVKGITNWTSMEDGKASIAAEDEKQFICYVRITDNVGNETFLSADGAVFDTEAPVISGISDGETYYTTQKFAAADLNLDMVTVNDVEVTDYTLAGNKDEIYTVKVTDKAGNITTVIVTMKTIASIEEALGNLTEDNVTTGDKDVISNVKEILEGLDVTEASDEEKEEITAAVEKCEELEKIIESKNVTKVFTDVYDNWYKDYIQYVYDHNLMNGIGGTTEFRPKGNITKAQVAQVLYSMEGKPEITDVSVFDELTDVSTEKWYADAVAWAYDSGVVTGNPNTGCFYPNDAVTREQLAVMMFRYAKLKNYDVSQTSDFAGFENADKIAKWAVDGMKWVVGAGVISGIDKGGIKDLAPQDTATRAQMAAILQRFCENVVK